jgi:hypothetical protein
VSHEKALSANARHECFVMDASVSVRTAETAEIDEKRVSAPPRLIPSRDRCAVG